MFKFRMGGGGGCPLTLSYNAEGFETLESVQVVLTPESVQVAFSLTF